MTWGLHHASPSTPGSVHTPAVGEGCLVVGTEQGSVYCFAER
jgi:hypothetical protein